jgi:hypothetical protein
MRKSSGALWFITQVSPREEEQEQTESSCVRQKNKQLFYQMWKFN